MSSEIDVIAKDLFADVSIDEVADCVQTELEALAVEDVWDRSGAKRDDYVYTGETAGKMFEAALEPFRKEMEKYRHTVDSYGTRVQKVEQSIPPGCPRWQNA